MSFIVLLTELSVDMIACHDGGDLETTHYCRDHPRGRCVATDWWLMSSPRLYPPLSLLSPPSREVCLQINNGQCHLI